MLNSDYKKDTTFDLQAFESKLGADVTVRSFENVTSDLTVYILRKFSFK